MNSIDVPIKNQLLAGLPHFDLELIVGAMKTLPLRSNMILHEPGEVLTQAYFPHSGAIVTGAVLDGGHFIESCVIGADGIVSGWPHLHECPRADRAEVEVEGIASVISVSSLRGLAMKSLPIADMLNRYASFLLYQAQWAAACNACHTLEQRLATLLLRLWDRSGDSALHVTQERLAEILGVKRTSLCTIAHRMQQAGVLNIRRGTIDLTDRARISKLACECYGKLNVHYRTLFVGKTRPLDLEQSA